ncbi:MAG: hypothetical protein LRZ98_02310 [Candidatus Pacebacteria bacterium]|nr:hypothetical protein [Candidatus Paceibacterota bacterium]
MNINIPPKIRVNFLDFKPKTSVNIKTKAPNEQTLKPSIIPIVIAKVPNDQFSKSISPIIGIVIPPPTIS